MSTRKFRTIIELPEFLDTNLLASSNKYAITGLDTEHPILQIDNLIFEGTFVETIGTHLVFSQETDAAGEMTDLKHSFNTTSKLIFKAITLAPKKQQ